MEHNFKYCSVCGRKIGFFRKLLAKQLDKDPLHLIPLSQFCSGNCAETGLQGILRKLKSKKPEKCILNLTNRKV